MASESQGLFSITEPDTGQFLQEFWGEHPLLLPEAFLAHLPPLAPLCKPERLLAMAMDEMIESRLIITADRLTDYQLFHGPFSDDFLADKKQATSWTILLQAVDQWIPEFADIAKLFHFLPAWRLDDLMISFGSGGGSVGPHLDNYDVFLIQLSGYKQWQIGPKLTATPESPHPELLLLEPFEATETYECSPGDVLYIPPRFQHWGVARDSQSVTLSVGFRSPSLDESLFSLGEAVARQHHAANQFYKEREWHQESDPSQISSQAIDTYRDLLQQLLADEELLAASLGELVTSPRYPDLVDEVEALPKQGEFCRNSHSRFAWRDTGDHIQLYVDGEMISCSRELQPLVQFLCLHRQAALEPVSTYLANEEAGKLLHRLCSEGKISINEEEHRNHE